MKPIQSERIISILLCHFFQHRPKAPQILISDIMPVLIVDRFEIVQIQIEQCKRLPGLLLFLQGRVEESLVGQELHIGTSCGSALYPADSTEVKEIRILADQRMYENKQANHARQDGAEGI